MTIFKGDLDCCRLSQSEAANFLNVSIDAVRSWSSGRRSPPDTVLQKMEELFYQIQQAIDEMHKRKERFTVVSEFTADEIRNVFHDIKVISDIPNGSLEHAFNTARLTGRIPEYIRRV